MERNIYSYRCTACGTLHYPFRMRCRNCGELEPYSFAPEPLPHRGTLLTFTFVHNLPAEFEVARLGMGSVEMQDDVRVTGQIEIPEPAIGMEVVATVEVVRRRRYEDVYGFVFRAAA